MENGQTQKENSKIKQKYNSFKSQLNLLFESLLGKDVVEIIKVDDTITVKIGSLDDLSDIFLTNIFTEFFADSGKVISFKGTVSVLVEKFEDSINLFLGVPM